MLNAQNIILNNVSRGLRNDHHFLPNIFLPVLLLYTLGIRYAHKKKSTEVKSSFRGGHCMSPLLEINRENIPEQMI